VSIVETLKKDIARKELELQKLKMAYEVIRSLEFRAGYDPEDDREREDDQPEEKVVPPSPPPPKAAPPTPLPPPRFKMQCSACDGEMYRAYKRVPSGITVEYWQCGEGSCNNEMY
jgi:hypothetical protein